MSYTKEIVCLANSRKPPSGRCVAGIERTEDAWGRWIRPVSTRDSEEVSEEERQYEDGTDPQILDVISIRFLERKPIGHQQENHIIDARYHWEKTGSIEWDELDDIADSVEGPIWKNHDSSYNGLHDQVSEEEAEQFDNSLLLVQPDELELCVAREGYQGPGKLKVRARFALNGHEYRLAVTDPKVERKYLRQGIGNYAMKADDVYFCISLSGAFHGFCYKLIASIIPRPK